MTAADLLRSIKAQANAEKVYGEAVERLAIEAKAARRQNRLIAASKAHAAAVLAYRALRAEQENPS